MSLCSAGQLPDDVQLPIPCGGFQPVTSVSVLAVQSTPSVHRRSVFVDCIVSQGAIMRAMRMKWALSQTV